MKNRYKFKYTIFVCDVGFDMKNEKIGTNSNTPCSFVMLDLI